jgi:cytochrome c oxidase subunit II
VRRGSIVQLVIIGLVAGAIATAVAIFIPWLPTPASREAGRIDFVYWFATVISLFIFAVVAAILTFALINFRVKPGDMSDGPPIHGHTTIEIIWTVIPAILVTAISIVSAIVLAQDSHAGKDPLVVKVYGEQFAWQFVYPNGYMSTTLHLPIDRGVKLRITSNDVIHSFWVPQFDQKQDAVPGQWNSIVITPDRTGIYPVICTELCGLGHSLMRSEAIVTTQAQFASWYAQTKQPPPPAGGSGSGSAGGSAAAATAAFTAGGCAACHTFTPIPTAKGTIGPSLDSLKKDAAAAGEPLDEFIQKSITDPNAYIAPGYQPNVMPSTFGSTLTKAQLDALVQYLAQNTN